MSIRGCGVFVLWLLLTALPRAQADDAKLRAAKAHFRQGASFFEAKQYARAITEYQAAWDTLPLPDFLFNLGQAHRLNGDLQLAVDDYQRYLKLAPEGPAHEEAAAHIGELTAKLQIAAMERAAADKAAAEKAAAEKAAAEKAAAAEAARQRAADENRAHDQAARTDADNAVRAEHLHTARSEKISGITVGAVGVASLASAIAFTVLAKSADDQFAHPSNGVFDPSAGNRRDRYQTLDAVFFTIGGVALATGITLYLVGRHQARSAK